MTVSVEEQVEERTRRAAPTWLRVVLVALVVAGGLGGLLCLPQSGGFDALVAHAQRGDVRVLQLTSDGLGSSTHAGDRDGSDGDRHLLWVDRLGLRHDVVLPGLAPAPTVRDDPGSAVDDLATVLAATPADRRPRVVEPGTLLRERLAGAGKVVLVLLLLSVALGTQPRRATKWAWTWLLVVLPLGAGAGLLLAREAPWSREITREREPRDRHDTVRGLRTTGGTALVAALLVALALQVLGWLAVEPLPYSRYLQPAPYDVVHLDGSRAPAHAF